jgi:hypothetical protein
MKIWCANLTVTVCIAYDEQEPTDMDCIEAALEEVRDNGLSSLALDYDAGGEVDGVENCPHEWLDCIPRRLGCDDDTDERTVRQILEVATGGK